MKEIVQVQIEKIVTGGLGLGRLPDGMVVLIPRVLPGEEVRFAARRHHKRFLEADLLEVLQPSPLRTDPPCKYYDGCGGCDLQHADYGTQLRLKEEIVRELLLRGKVCDAEYLSRLMEPAAPSPEILGYRQRLRLQVNSSGKPGFYRERSHEVVPVRTCLLAGAEINTVLNLLHDDRSAAPLLEAAESVELLLNPLNRRVLVLFRLTEKPDSTLSKTGRDFSRNHEMVQGVLLFGKDGGPTIQAAIASLDQKISGETCEDMLITIPVRTEVAGRPFNLSLEPGGFSQVNGQQNEKCMATLLDWGGASSDDRLLDLYCGMGNFTLPFALRLTHAVGMDLAPSSIRSARRNAEMAGLANCHFFEGSAQKGIERLVKKKEHFDLLLLDPPRTGCREVIEYVPDLGVKKILIVSCDPATLTRDLFLLRERGYEPRRLRIIDMFPQTHHIETITLLTRA